MIGNSSVVITLRFSKLKDLVEGTGSNIGTYFFILITTDMYADEQVKIFGTDKRSYPSVSQFLILLHACDEFGNAIAWCRGTKELVVVNLKSQDNTITQILYDSKHTFPAIK